MCLFLNYVTGCRNVSTTLPTSHPSLDSKVLTEGLLFDDGTRTNSSVHYSSSDRVDDRGPGGLSDEIEGVEG